MKYIIVLLLILISCKKQINTLESMAYYVEINADGTPKTASLVFTERGDDPLIDITECITKRWPGSTRELVQPRYYIIVNNNYVPQSGTLTTARPTTGKFVDITQCYLKQTAIDTFLTDENALYAIIIVGNSNATGMSTQDPPVGWINEAINNSKKVEWNDDESAMIIVDNTQTTPQDRLAQHIFQPTFYGYYNPIVLVGNEMSKIIQEKTGKALQFITISGAVNGGYVDNGDDNGLPELSNNSIHFQYLEDGLQAAKTYADSINKTLKVPFAILIGGEIEAIRFPLVPESYTRYSSVLFQYRRNLQTMVQAITGDTYNFPIYRTQHHAQQTTDTRNMDVKQYAYDSNIPDMPLITPTYQLSILMNFDHWDTESIFKIFGTIAHRIFKYQYQKVGKVFDPYKFTVEGTTITIDVHVPTPPLVIDTSRGTEENHGFTILGAGDVEIPISSVSVSGNQIIINSSSDVTGATLYYKLKRPYAPDLNRFGSYIGDSEIIETNGFTLRNYLLSFKKAL